MCLLAGALLAALPAGAAALGSSTSSSAATATTTTGTGGTSTGTGTGTSAPTTSKPSASATVQQCITSETQSERSATFAGEMSAITGATKMEMQIGLLERAPLETAYRAVSAPGLDTWMHSAPGVKVYKSLDQVTNLAAPADYRGVIRFRWLNAKGRVVRSLELRTPRCQEPGEPSTLGGSTTTTSATGD